VGEFLAANQFTCCVKIDTVSLRINGRVLLKLDGCCVCS